MYVCDKMGEAVVNNVLNLSKVIKFEINIDLENVRNDISTRLYLYTQYSSLVVHTINELPTIDFININIKCVMMH